MKCFLFLLLSLDARVVAAEGASSVLPAPPVNATGNATVGSAKHFFLPNMRWYGTQTDYDVSASTVLKFGPFLGKNEKECDASTYTGVNGKIVISTGTLGLPQGCYSSFSKIMT